MRKTTTIALLCLLLTTSFLVYAGSLPQTTIIVGKTTINVEAPVLWGDRAKGLSGRERLEPGKGMVFAYLKPHTISMHMQDMLFGLDFIFCRSGKIVQIERGVQPSGRPVALSSDQPVHLVLEIAGGQAEALGLSLGDGCKLKMTPQLQRLLKQTQQK